MSDPADLGDLYDAAGERDIAALVEAARRHDQTAWNRIVQLFSPLVHTIARDYRLSERDAEDVGQVVWLRLLEHLDRLREPKALPGWIVTTVRHESSRVARSHGRTLLVDSLDDSAHDLAVTPADVDAGLLHAEEVQVVRDGLAELPTAQRNLLLLLAADPQPSYRQISMILDMPIGSIGPTRARSLARLGATSAVSQYVGSASRKLGRRPCAA